MKTKKTTSLSVSIVLIGLWPVLSNIDVKGAALIFSDDFTTANPAWQFALTDTQDNPTAITASYGQVSGGYLQLKANVGPGWDYLYSWATLNLALPADYEIDYQAQKLEWSGALWTIVTSSQTQVLDAYPSYHFAEAGNTAYGLVIDLTPSTYIEAPATITSFDNGPWYSYRIVKTGQHLDTFVNGILQHSVDGLPFDGGVLEFAAVQAGATVNIDNLQVYSLVPEPRPYALLGFGLVILVAMRRKLPVQDGAGGKCNSREKTGWCSSITCRSRIGT